MALACGIMPILEGLMMWNGMYHSFLPLTRCAREAPGLCYGLIRARAIAMLQAPPLKRCEGDGDPTWKDTWLP
jgi:hypothetical protein